MSELPASWVKTTLGQVVSYADNETTDPADMPPLAWLLELEDIERDTGKVLERKTVEERAPKSSKNRFQTGDVLYGKLRPYLNKVVRADQDGFCSSEIIAISPDLLDKNYLFHSMRSPDFIKYVSSVSHGMRMPRLGTQQAKSAPFALPPLAEQTRIAAKLDELLAQVNTLKTRIDAIPALLKRFHQSVLAAAVSGRLTEEWRKTNDHAVDIATAAKIHQSEWLATRQREYQRKQKEYCENTILRKFKPAPFQEDGNLPPSWLTTSLSNLAEVTDPNPSHRMPKYTDTGTPFISTENFGNNRRIDFSIGKKVAEEELEAQRARYEIQEGTFAFTRIGTIGRSIFLPTPHNYCISHAVAVVQPYTKLTAPKFLKLVASAPSTLSQATDGVQSVGVPDLGVGKMKSFKIPLPPLAEQTEIVRRVEQLFAFADQLEAKVASAKSRIDHLNQSILAKAFRGELVPQDPSDEPASVLLERIKAQRATAPKTKRGRKASA